MTKRKQLSASLRWSVFARDGFACRYCGAKAGDPGVTLHADHLRSVAEGGTDVYDNLVTACSRCNGGKGARSLSKVPDAAEVADRMKARAKSIKKQADSLEASLQADAKLKAQAKELKAYAYDNPNVWLERGEDASIARLCKEFGSETVLRWYETAYRNRVSALNAVRYVCGIARNVRRDQNGGE